MNLTELAADYRRNAEPIKARMTELRRILRCEHMSETDRLHLRQRLARLEDLYYETLAIAGHMEHYYEKGYRRNAYYTL